MGDPWGIGGFRGGGCKPNINQIVKKKSVEKSQKSAKSEKIVKIGFFLTKNGLKCSRSPKKHI